jgi:hypothetical protein
VRTRDSRRFKYIYANGNKGIIMKIISHRGFLNGNNEMYEVDQNHLEKLFYDTPFDVEIDIRQYDSNFFIGHDEFEASKIDKSFLDKWTDRL